MDKIQATTADAELVLRLYDLRRESEMRKARNWFASEFWPRDYAELEQIMWQFGSEQSRWIGQLCSYWDMAASLVVRGTLHPGLFFDTCGEAWFVYAKLKPFVQEGRTKMNSPEFLANLEKVIEGSAEGRERLQRMQEHFARFASMIEKAREKNKQSTGKAA
jgi:hypothetical protein